MKLLLLSLLLLSVTFTAAQADWIAKSDKNSHYVLRAQGAFAPESIASYGLEEFDSNIVDLNIGAFERSFAANEAIVKELQRRLDREKHPKVRQDLQILIDSVSNENARALIRRKHLLSYTNVHLLIFKSLRSLLDPRNDPKRYPAALARLSKYRGVDQHPSLTELARARTEERFEVEGLQGPFIKALQDDIDNAPRYVEGLRGLLENSKLEGWQTDFEALEAQLGDYLVWVKAEVLPRARKNYRLPRAVYENNLKNFGVLLSPEELIEQAQYSYQFIRSEMKALAWKIAETRAWEDKSLVSVMRKLKAEQIPRDQILDLYKQRLRDLETIIRREDIVSLPKRDANIRLASPAESAASPAPFMSPPQLINNTGQYGEFVLVQSNPALKDDAQMDDWSHDAITWSLTVHEARPGHELQFTHLVENGTSLARSLFAFNSANVEGWGLYSESIMHEFLPQEAQLFNLFTRLVRAARMFLDPMVNLGQMSHPKVIEFLTTETALSLPMASSEADRYAFRAPGQATSYFVGYMNLMRLRTEVEIALGDRFNQRAFHDFILEQGLLPPALLREAVLDEFVRK